jgi:hypothetical protein
MSARLPIGSALEDGSVHARGGTGATDVSGGVECSTDAAQQAHVHRTQNAGQPLSGADSLVPIGHVSGTRSELTPLASATSTASTAMRNARRMTANISVGVPRLRPLERQSTSTDQARVSRGTPTDESSRRRTGCVGQHRQELRRGAGRRLGEALVPCCQRFGHRCACGLQSQQLFVHFPGAEHIAGQRVTRHAHLRP